MTVESLRHLEALFKANSIEETWRLHCRAMEAYGFDRLIYGFTRFLSPRSLGHPNDLLVLSTIDPAYIQKFIRDGMFEHAPMVRWASQNSGACSWRWRELARDTMTEAERRVLDLNRSFDLLAGYTISFPEVSTRSRGAIGLIAPPGTSQDEVEERWAVDGAIIHLLNNAFHLKATSLPYTGVNPLTRRQREVLEWVGDGKSVQDIAVILGVSTPTVEKHLRLAREALGVETTAQAVLKASFKNQIFVATPPQARARCRETLP